MEPFFPFVLLGLAVGLLIWGVSNLSVQERYTKLFATIATAVGVAVLGWFFTTYGKGGLSMQFSQDFFSSDCWSGG